MVKNNKILVSFEIGKTCVFYERSNYFSKKKLIKRQPYIWELITELTIADKQLNIFKMSLLKRLYLWCIRNPILYIEINDKKIPCKIYYDKLYIFKKRGNQK